MSEAWIPIECPQCGKQWEQSPSNLPSPGNEFDCDDCDAERPVTEFLATQRGYEMLNEFHE